MTETQRKFGTDPVVNYDIRCRECGERYGNHSGAECPERIVTVRGNTAGYGAPMRSKDLRLLLINHEKEIG